ncbi:MAG: hypothetical protein KAS30_02855, partial [Candidatus Diapherotrites archaeon]|nr:hypothetical protein [Candidatus Diapherotrites archaeon]
SYLLYMDLEEIIENEDALKKSVKRNCTFCMGRAHLGKPNNPEKDNVQKDLEGLYYLYEDKFDELRKEDSEAEDIQNSLKNKRAILDLIDICKKCDREADKANRAMNELKE